MARAILYDSTRCVGCRECEKTCSSRWGLPYNDKIAAEEKISSLKLTTVQTHGDKYSRKLCMHCLEPTCASVCPVGAFTRTALGPVTYDGSKCMGCRYCMAACPFQVPAYEWESRLPKVRKCDMCGDRAPAGQPTRCSQACPVEATITGDRAALLQEARQRIAQNPGQYVDRIYGVEEVGGTSVLLLSSVPFEQIGFRTDLPTRALPSYTWDALQHIPDVVAIGGVLLGCVYWLTARKLKVAETETGGAARSGKGMRS
jgi:formate dehydrogenase iron-sulfur subunit